MNETNIDIAIKESLKSKKEIPVGAIITKNNKIITKSHNKRERNKNVICHAEIIAIEKMCKKIKDWRLNDFEMYVTLEPCVMCLGVIVESRIKKVYFGIENEKYHKINEIICKEFNIKLIKKIYKNEEIKTNIKNFFTNKR